MFHSSSWWICNISGQTFRCKHCNSLMILRFKSCHILNSALLNTLYKYVKTKILLFNIWLLARAFMIWLTLKLKALTLSYTASVSAPNTNKFVKLSLNIFYFDYFEFILLLNLSFSTDGIGLHWCVVVVDCGHTVTGDGCVIMCWLHSACTGFYWDW